MFGKADGWEGNRISEEFIYDLLSFVGNIGIINRVLFTGRDGSSRYLITCTRDSYQ